MSVNQSEERESSGLEHHEVVMPSKWSRVAGVSAVLWILLSLPFLVFSGRVVTFVLYQPDAFIKNIWSLDFVTTLVMAIVAPLPIISGIATIAFLSLRSARSRRIATICLRFSLLGMAALIVLGIAMAKEGERMGGDTGPLQVVFSILVGVASTLIIIPSILGLISLWRLKHTISEKE